MLKQKLESAPLQEILDNFPDGMFTIDTNMIIQYANPAFCRILGYPENELHGTPITDHLGDLSILDSCMTSIGESGHCNDQETIFIRKDGSIVHISKNVQALYDEQGNIHSILGSIRDMTALHQLNKELLESKYDALTKLPNRTKLLSDIEHIESPITIILLNIDSFKEVNTFYGHEIADQVLLSLGTELESYAKSIGESIIYKLPVDEYAILLKGSYSDEEIKKFISGLTHYINNKLFMIQGQEISLNVTIGVAGSNHNPNAERKRDIMAH
ncbi:MAG TPA: PAS domain S-box protein, partial [Sulfuricurvum sp.]|nr:PAS domain S-box protein [Sulfuricurvum sp.]